MEKFVADGRSRVVFAGETFVRALFRCGALDAAWDQMRACETINRFIDVTKSDHGQQQPRDCETVAPKPVQVTLCGLLAHEEQDHRASIERRYGKQVERAQEQIQGEEDEKCNRRGPR